MLLDICERGAGDRQRPVSAREPNNKNFRIRIPEEPH